MKIKLHRSGHVTLIDDIEGSDRVVTHTYPPSRSTRILSCVDKADRQRVANHLLRHSHFLLPARWNKASLKVGDDLRVSGRFDPNQPNYEPGRYDLGSVIDVLAEVWNR